MLGWHIPGDGAFDSGRKIMSVWTTLTQDAELVAKDVENAFGWLEKNGPSILAALQSTLAAAEAAEVSIQANVKSAAGPAITAVEALIAAIKGAESVVALPTATPASPTP